MTVIFIAKKLNISEKLIQELEKHADIEFVEKARVDFEKIKALRKPGAKMLAPFPEPLDWKLPNAILDNIAELKGVCLSTTSFDWVDGEFLRSKGIPLTNVPGCSTNAVAEGAIFMMVAVARRLPIILNCKEFDYVPENALVEVCGKTAGIIGLGNIGSRVAELAKSLGMNVVYWSRSSRNRRFRYLCLKKLLKTADFVFVCLEMNEDTGNFISSKEINSLKNTTGLVDVSHRGVVDWKHLVERVGEGKLFGAASDNAEQRNYSGNVFVMPHVNWYTKETLEEKSRIWVQSILSVIKGKPENRVN
ncbi:MAG: NAD(P)-dependent oxidoreductase [Candidatus Dojkabacteria bacterium]|nr:NAD(P)-dependent oxidoreductase [Candidatus Dojkabacteria bacterium]